ncbi:ABC transporter permease [Brevibacterium linens]|uniref:ABC-type Na+ efflux pump, permease component n=1 Tax=Brevibacterium linens ATCC 9172 TaxID=1255617 RepID=A0A2H1JU17_BRELN|nr:sodium ABC transporter permease [Brevibacterium linens]SMX90959.1 ABC-type Na+ efflux pump, permease component [Brevibacterium linens ATCC 9172]
MARKDNGANDESPEPLVSKGTAGEGIDDLGVPVDDDVIEDEATTDEAESDDEATATGATKGSAASAKKKSAAKSAAAKGSVAKDTDESDATDGLDDVPFELAEDTPDPDELPETGLVSEFVDVGNRQAAWLVSNRESTTAMRSPYFLVTAAVIILGVLAAIISGIVADVQKDSGTPTMAMVGVGEQAAMYEQQLGVKITDAKDAPAAEKLVREGKVDAAFIQDPSGQGQPTIIALDKQPDALLEKLAPKTEATLLETPAVDGAVATPLLWGMVALSLLVVATLGTALYQNLRLEKRNRITEIIAATIPPRASASGRITGMLTLVIVHLVVAAVITELGLSLSGKTSLAFAMLPGLGWFALALLLTAWSVFALLVWASTVVGSKARATFLTIIGVITVAGFFAPVLIGSTGTVAKVLSWTPFTSPLGIAGRSFAGQTEWWEGLVAAGIALVLAVILHALASGAYVRSVLSGGGRGGKTVKMSKRAQKVGAATSAKGSAKSDSAADDSDSDADDADADDADSDDVDSDEDANSAVDGKSKAASAKKSNVKAKDEEDAKSADDSRDDK